MCRRDLACVLLGVLLTTGAFGVRSALQYQQQLEERVSYIEMYLAMLDKAMRSGR